MLKQPRCLASHPFSMSPCNDSVLKVCLHFAGPISDGLEPAPCDAARHEKAKGKTSKRAKGPKGQPPEGNPEVLHKL